MCVTLASMQPVVSFILWIMNDLMNKMGVNGLVRQKEFENKEHWNSTEMQQQQQQQKEKRGVYSGDLTV